MLCAALGACGTLSRMELDTDAAPAQRLAASSDLKAEVDGLAQPLIERGENTGLVVGVLAADGQAQYFGYGVTAQGGNRPDGDTLFAIGSLSKGFLGGTTAILVEEGALGWDETLATLLPAHVKLSDDARRITLRQLVTHTSGLPRQPFTPETLRYFIEYLFTGKSFYRHFDRDYLLNYLATFKKSGEARPQYSNIGYGILGAILELRSGQRIDALVHQKILTPLQLDHTGYVPAALPGYATRARGHAGDQPKMIRRGQPVPDWEFTDVMSGSAALYSNAHDLLAYARAHLYPGADALRDRALRNSLQVQFARPQEAAATAWIVDEIEGRKITYQIGLVAGYTAYIGMDVESRMAVVVLQNNFNWTNRIGHRLLLRMVHAQQVRTR
ncbi:serine hydrolase [Massilia sp. CF038]|uniref:serine hydrolase domain-containing protein n=1 Tax=Massilia sp. CF038 TaxID=1881045 RepID=UPI001E4DD264|nr:serine hydrolase [Massilia sp. CF038]